MKFLTKNYLKYKMQCQNGILKNRLGNNGTFINIMDLHLLLCRFVNIDIVKKLVCEDKCNRFGISKFVLCKNKQFLQILEV